MHIIYVDESGDNGFRDINNWLIRGMPQQFFIRTALIVDDQKCEMVNQEVKRLKDRWMIPEEIELHASEIMNGRISRKRMGTPNFYRETFPDPATRKDLLKEICLLIKSLNLTVIGVIIDKAKIKRDLRGRYRMFPKNNSWRFLFERLDFFLSKQCDKEGMIISDEIQLQTENWEHLTFLSAVYARTKHNKRFHFIESIVFEKSESSLLLQLADMVAYAFYRCCNAADKSYYMIIRDCVFKNNNKVLGAGVKIWPK